MPGGSPINMTLLDWLWDWWKSDHFGGSNGPGWRGFGVAQEGLPRSWGGPWLFQNRNTAFLNFFIRYRIVGTCFFEGFPHRDRGMYVYLDNYKGLLRKRTHFCLSERTGLVRFGGQGRKDGKKERSTPLFFYLYLSSPLPSFLLTDYCDSVRMASPSSLAQIHSILLHPECYLVRHHLCCLKPLGLTLPLEYMCGPYHLAPPTSLASPCTTPRLWALWPQWPSHRLLASPGPLHTLLLLPKGSFSVLSPSPLPPAVLYL